MEKESRKINYLLFSLTAIDLFLCLFFGKYSELFFLFVLNEYCCGMSYFGIYLGSAFLTTSIIEMISFLNWRRQPMWLAAMVGVKILLTGPCLGLIILSNITFWGYVILISFSILCLILAFIFIRFYRKLIRR